jgi:hypothetical protein
MLKVMSACDLAALRQQLLASFEDGDNEAADLLKMDKLHALEEQISMATYNTPDDKLAGLVILLEHGDGPDFADDFKRKLFIQMQEFA